jgi:transcription-repair coupling factor (superfamily II helicase)
MIGVRYFLDSRRVGKENRWDAMFDEIRKKIENSRPFLELAAVLKTIDKDHPVTLQGIHGSLLAFVGAQIFDSVQTQVLLVVPDKDRAEQLRDDCAYLLGEGIVHVCAAGPSHASKLLDMSAPIAQVGTLRALVRGDRVFVVASADALAVQLPPTASFLDRTLELEVGKEYPFEQLLGKLTALRFEKKDFVEEYGDVAVRGGIVDIFPFVGDNPIRFEFWGDAVESIREFDVLSQRSIRDLQSASIVARLDDTDESVLSPGTKIPLLRYFSPDTLVVLEEPILLQKEIEELAQEDYSHIYPWDDIKNELQKYSRCTHSLISNIPSPGSVYFESQAHPPLAGSVKRLIEQL